MEAFYLCNSEIFGLSNSTAVIYNFLCKVNNISTGKSFYKKENIAQSCNVSKSTVVRAFRTLCAKGLLEIRRRFDHGRQTSNEYILIHNPQLKLPEQVSEKNINGKTEPLCQPRLFKCNPSVFYEDLSANEMKVYSYLAFRAGKDKKCMPAKKEIASDCKISVSTVSRALNALSKAGLIEIQQQTRKALYGNNGTSVNLYLLKACVSTPKLETNPKQMEDFSACSSDANPRQQDEFSNCPQVSAMPSSYTEHKIKPAAMLRLLITGKLLNILSAEKTIKAGRHFFLFTDDTLADVNRDTPRTTSRKKATLNSRNKSIPSKLDSWYTRIKSRVCRNE